MNFFSFKLNITRSGSKMLYSFALFFIIFLFLYTYSYSQEKSSAEIILSEGTLTDEQFYGEYTYRHYTGPPFNEDVFQVFHDDQIVYQSKVAFGFSLYQENELYSHGKDITGDGIPNLLVLEGGGGSSAFSDSCHVLSLGEQCKLIQTLPVGEFVDLNEDGILEYLTRDGVFTFWYAGHANSPAPRMVLAYREGQYKLAPTLMYQPLPEQELITRKVSEARSQCEKLKTQKCYFHCWHQGEVYLDPSVWGFMLDLLYTGHPIEAMDFLDQVWPEGEEGKELFLIEFKQRLNSSKEWKRIRDKLYQTQEEKALWTMKVGEGYGQIKIFSIPTEATVIFDGERKGQTPFSLSGMPVGEYTITLDKLGYEEWEEEILIFANQVIEVDVRLLARTDNAIVRIWISPNEKANILIDGEYVGERSLLLKNVPQGEHTIKVTKEGYQDWENTLSFYQGESYIVTVDLKAIPEEEVLPSNAIWIPIGLLLFMFLIWV